MQNHVNAGGDAGEWLPTIHLSKTKAQPLQWLGFFLRSIQYRPALNSRLDY